MNELLITLFLDAIPTAYKKHLDNDLVGRANSNFWNIFTSFLRKYGRRRPNDHELNLHRMKKYWDVTCPIEDLFSQINDAKEYSIFAGNAYNDATLVNAGEIIILRTSALPMEYKAWRALPDVNRTWENFQEYWQEVYDLHEETGNKH